MFYATGLTGWQRAAAEEPAAPEPVAAPVEQDEVTGLKDQAVELSRTLQQIQDRLAVLEGKAEEPTVAASNDA